MCFFYSILRYYNFLTDCKYGIVVVIGELVPPILQRNDVRCISIEPLKMPLQRHLLLSH